MSSSYFRNVALCVLAMLIASSNAIAQHLGEVSQFHERAKEKVVVKTKTVRTLAGEETEETVDNVKKQPTSSLEAIAGAIGSLGFEVSPSVAASAAFNDSNGFFGNIQLMTG